MKTLDKHFGKIGSMILLISIPIINISSKNPIEYKSYLNFNTNLFVAITFLFFLVQYFTKNKFVIPFRIGFLFLLFTLQVLFITKFMYMVELENSSPEISISDKNAAESLSVLIIFPTLFIIFIFLGTIFDCIHSINKKKSRVIE